MIAVTTAWLVHTPKRQHCTGQMYSLPVLQPQFNNFVLAFAAVYNICPPMTEFYTPNSVRYTNNIRRYSGIGWRCIWLDPGSPVGALNGSRRARTRRSCGAGVYALLSNVTPNQPLYTRRNRYQQESRLCTLYFLMLHRTSLCTQGETGIRRNLVYCNTGTAPALLAS